MGGGGGKGGGTTVQSVQIPPEVLARYNAVNARAERVAEQPFQQYGGEFVAPLTPTQQQGIAATSAASQMAQPYYGAATGLTLAGAQGVMPGRLQTGRYMSPFTQAVAAPTQQAMAQEYAAQRSGLMNPQTAAAFGGDRSGLVAANLARQQMLGTAQGLAPIYQQGYQQAQNIAAQQQAQDLAARQANLARLTQAGAQVGGLGAAAQQAALSGAQAQIGAGTLQQQTQQALNQALYNQFLQERGYPFQVAQFLANIAEGTGALSGSTTTTQQPGSFFSDERDKTNIKPLGKGLYAYDYKEDVEHARETGQPMPPKRVGPMAQDIEKQAPGLVVSVNGHKVVTNDNSMGGAVNASGAFARGGYANGGYPDFSNILQAQMAMFGGPGQQQKSAGLGIPSQKSSGPRQLMTPSPLPQRQRPPNMFKEAGDTAKGVEQTWTGLEKLKKALTPSDTGDKLTPRVPQDSGQTTPTTQAPAGTTPAANTTVVAPTNTGLAPTVGVTKADVQETPVKDDLVQNANLEAPDLNSSGFDMIDLATGGRAYAYGGLVPRHGYAGAGFVTPGYDTEHDPSDIMDTVVEEGEQSPQQLLSEQKGMAGGSGGAGGGGGGMSPLSALSAGASIASLGAKVLPFLLKDGGSVSPYAYGGLVPRQAHADGERVVEDQPQEESGLNVSRIMNKITPEGVNAPENFWIPALSFVGGMLSSPSRTLAGSVGSGLLSGVQGYSDLSKQQAANAKNVIDVFKDRYQEMPDPSDPSKIVMHNSFTGKNHAPAEVGNALYQSLKALGVQPERYGVFPAKTTSQPQRESTQQPVEGGAGTTQERPALAAPAPGEGTVVAQTQPAAAPAVQKEATPEGKQGGPDTLTPSEMNRGQLRNDVIRNPEKYGVSDDVRRQTERIVNAEKRLQGLKNLPLATASAQIAREQAEMKDAEEKREKLIQDAIDRQDKANLKFDELRATSAKDYGDRVTKRLGEYETQQRQILDLNNIYAAFESGRSTEAKAALRSWLAGVPGAENIKWLQEGRGDFDSAMKLAMTQTIDTLQAKDMQRAPASGVRTISLTVPGPTLEPAATYSLLGRMLGELEWSKRKDMAYKEGQSPLQFEQTYRSKNPGSLKDDVAAGLAQLRIHKNMDPKILQRLMDEYGYVPAEAKDVKAKASAPAVAPGKQPGERKQFKQGWGVWDGSKWVPEGQP